MALPSIHDVWFLVRAILTRPGDVPGILRRGKARTLAAKPADPDGLAFLTESWAAALAANGFRAPPGDGPVVAPDVNDPAEAVSALQTASGVDWGAAGPTRILGALSLEATRLSLPQATADPDGLKAARSLFLESAALPFDLRAALEALSEEAGCNTSSSSTSSSPPAPTAAPRWWRRNWRAAWRQAGTGG